jgi:hypothetical protein
MMANKMVSNIKSLTTGVGDLVKTVDKLYASLNKVNTAATKALTSASSTVSTVGGQYGLTQGANRPGTGADAAHFPTASGGVGPKQNIMSASLAAFSAMGGYPGYGQYGPSRFPYPGMPPMPPMGGGMSTRAFGAMGAVQFGLGIASGAYQMMPGLQPTMDRTLGYYQAGLRAPGINRNQLERATFGAMGGGLSGVGSDAQVAAILAGMGYAPGSQNYLGAAGQIGGAYKYLGMSNEAAAAAIGGFQTGPMQANLFQYGITTFDMGTGKEKTTGQIAKELMNYMTGGRNVTVKQVQESYKMGALGANLQTMGFSADQQTMLYQAMIDLASGRNPDLQNAAPVKGNENTFLTSQGRLNASTTDVMMSAEEKMIKGFENAADTVEFFNRQVKHAADALGYIIGYSQGVSGTPAGKGAGKIGKSLLGGALVAGGIALSEFGIGIPMAAAGAAMLASGGSSSGFGSSFGVSNRNKTGGSSPAAGAPVTAGYGATNNSADSPWAGTNGSHTGVDYAMPIGTAVTSVYDGTVSAVNLNADYGTSVMIDNINGTQAVYAHLSEKSVKVGDTVKQGQRIGKSGKSGNAQEPHLHFELRDAKNHPVDPSSILSGVGGTTSLFGDYATVRPTIGNLTKKSSSSTNTSSTSGAALTIGNYTGSKDSLSDSSLREILMGAGFSGASLETAMQVVRAESGGRPGALNPNASTGDYSMGLFQINMIGDLGVKRNEKYLKEYAQYGYTGPESLYDPAVNARIAYDISKSGTTWSNAWVNTSRKLGIGGATSGYGAAVPSASVSSGNNTVNVTLKIERASEEEAVQFAKRVKYYLEHDNETSMIGRA